MKRETKLSVRIEVKKPRNPTVAAMHGRKAGAHRDGRAERLARALRRELKHHYD